MVKIRNKINDIEPYVPGRSIKEIADAYGLKEDEIIKLGSNENPLAHHPQRWRPWRVNLNRSTDTLSQPH